MKTIQLEQLSVYLPYKLKVIYNGIINHKEISKYNKEYGTEINPSYLDMSNDKDYNPPKEIIGKKEGYIKRIGIYKNHAVCEIGTFNYGLKKFFMFERTFKVETFKPLLYPLSKYKDINSEYMNNLGIDLSDQIWINELANGWVNVSKVPFNVIQIMAKKHIDIFNLIGQGLAEPIK